MVHPTPPEATLGASVSWRSFGSVQVLPLLDAVGPFFQPMADAFPAATAGVRRRADEVDVGATTSDGGWLVHFRCFAVRLADGRVFLVDAGVGPAQAAESSWAPVPGRLPVLLDAAGIDRAAVDAVVLTHLHSDHVGWAVVDDSPYFTNARYVLQRTEAAAVGDVNPYLRAAVLDPLAAEGRLALVDGRESLAADVMVWPTPGHTPGHQSLWVTAGDKELMLTGDVLVHAVQLVDPTVAYTHESDPETARETRLRLLDHAAARGAVLATAHLAAAFTDVG